MADTSVQTLSDFNENNDLYQNTDAIVENIDNIDSYAQSSLDVIGNVQSVIQAPVATTSKIAGLTALKETLKSGVERVDEVPAEDQIYAVASDIAYEHFINAGDTNKTQDKLDQYASGYTLDPQLSNELAVTLQTPDNKAILAFRGTYSAKDIETDIAIATGRHRLPKDIVNKSNQLQKNSLLPSQFSDAQALYEKVKATYGDVTLTGHSKGGTLGDYIARNNNEKAITFNQGDSLLALPFEETLPSDTKAYITDSDLISISTLAFKGTNKPIIVKQKEVNNDLERLVRGATGGLYDPAGHSLKNFLPKDYLVSIPKVRQFIPFENEDYRFRQSKFTVKPFSVPHDKKEVVNNYCEVFKDETVCGRRAKLKLRR
jgi:hypothetical protein